MVDLFTQEIHHSDMPTLKLLGAIGCDDAHHLFLVPIFHIYNKDPGSHGWSVLAKVFGLITLALGIQFILTGIQGERFRNSCDFTGIARTVRGKRRKNQCWPERS